jgi:hypothetical protein
VAPPSELVLQARKYALLLAFFYDLAHTSASAHSMLEAGGGLGVPRRSLAHVEGRIGRHVQVLERELGNLREGRGRHGAAVDVALRLVDRH